MDEREMETFVAQVVHDAERTFGAHLGRALLEAFAREAVLDLWMSGGSITGYTAELALNQIHDQIAARAHAFATRTSQAA